MASKTAFGVNLVSFRFRIITWFLGGRIDISRNFYFLHALGYGEDVGVVGMEGFAPGGDQAHVLIPGSGPVKSRIIPIG